MSPNGQTRGKSIGIADNIYTVILAIACGVVVASVVFTAYMCYSQYEAIFTMP